MKDSSSKMYVVDTKTCAVRNRFDIYSIEKDILLFWNAISIVCLEVQLTLEVYHLKK